MSDSKHVGTAFDDFLEEEGLLAESHAVAVKRVVAWQLAETMKSQGITKTEMARKMGTSRASLNRLLDPGNTSVTLQTIDRAAAALGKRLRVELADEDAA